MGDDFDFATFAEGMDFVELSAYFKGMYRWVAVARNSPFPAPTVTYLRYWRGYCRCPFQYPCRTLELSLHVELF